MEHEAAPSPHESISVSSDSDNLTAVPTSRDRCDSQYADIRSGTLSRRQTNLNNVELERIETYRLQHRSTVGSGPGVAPRSEWLPMGAEKPYPPDLPDPEQFIVEFTGSNDPLHPQNWSLYKRIGISATLAYTTFVSSFASAIYSAATLAISQNFHISTEVAILGVTLYVLGFASASPIAIVPAVFADIWNNQTRGVAIAMFAMAVFVGPFASPFTGGFITMSYLGWRWTMYIAAIMGFLAVGLCVLFLKETYAPAILVEKAKTLRRQTHNWGIRARQEEVELDWEELITNNFSRPFRMLFTEPIVFLQIHGMNLGVGSLPFIGLIIGEFLAGGYILYDQRAYSKKLADNHNIPIPEWRLPPSILGGVCFTIGLFWFGWTGWTKSIHWMAPTASGVITGFGIYVIFLQCFNYLIDSYLTFAASVFAANTIMRSAVGAAFPLFSKQMFQNLGVQWAGTLLGCLALIMVPIPLAFIKWGPALRKKSKFAPIFGPMETSEKEPRASV
ncbi:hypothetical protein N7450_000954 [Penicillium hetheringtonii]|uniref:Major facilitator superfamily (MFS) profile domain-containing protein n=1 Tax=Penicillium hetheringtonii TaxID=911720 RepID=A0AAD6E3N2_9EURO|nr:hypothetical protein N7450_000954 [Penicillium hetheringtonii]